MKSRTQVQKASVDRSSSTPSSLTSLSSTKGEELQITILNTSTQKIPAMDVNAITPTNVNESQIQPKNNIPSSKAERKEYPTTRVPPCDCSTCEFHPEDWPWKNAKLYMRSCWTRCPYCNTQYPSVRNLKRHLLHTAHHRSQNIKLMDEDISTLVKK